ncbi:MAG: pyridoxal phosphate-dependent decarboxylase family protein [Acidimicrobiia bacterium]
MHAVGKGEAVVLDLPDDALSAAAIRDIMDAYGADDVDWRHGRGWSLVYDSPEPHQSLVLEAAARFANENALSAGAFPSASHFESAVISMVASVIAPRTRPVGIFASGGTESTFIALKAYRDATPAKRSVVVVPATAHPAFGKAAAYLGLELVQVPVGLDGLPTPEAVIDAIDERTAVVGLSAPCYPFGVVDPIAEIAAGAAARGVGIHIDAALGGLFLPFLDAVGATPPEFGTDVPGVTSVAVDLHKYGYGAKGASVVLFADRELRHAAYHVTLGWPGGAYASSGVLGTRSVGPAAAAFAAMVGLGRSGYRELVRNVMQTARSMQRAMCESGPFELVGRPETSVFAVTSGELPIPAVIRGLEARGWRIDAQESPPAMHFIVFPRHAAVVDELLRDLEVVVGEVGAGQTTPSGPLSSYGVMVRSGGTATREALLDHLDARFDCTENPAPFGRAG